MNLGIYLRHLEAAKDEPVSALITELNEAGFSYTFLNDDSDLGSISACELLLSVGGDGTFLSASHLAVMADIPILGLNYGRMGFLADASSDQLCKYLLNKDYNIEHRDLLEASVYSTEGHEQVKKDVVLPYALNELCIRRKEAAIIGVRLKIDGHNLPIIWGDGIIISTASGSTAYALSAGGPICSPNASVFTIVPLAAHNLNVRPLVIPNSSKISISLLLRQDLSDREPQADLFMDNHSFILEKNDNIELNLAKQSLKKLELKSANYVKALVEKLHWAEDIRNSHAKLEKFYFKGKQYGK